MSVTKKIAAAVLLGVVLLVVSFNLWGYLTLGTLTPGKESARDAGANAVVMVFGASGTVGDGLLQAAIEDPNVKKVYVVTRNTSPRMEDGGKSGKVEIRLHRDFTDYSSLADILGEVNTVLWGLGTSSLNVDDTTYTKIHVDFPEAFVSTWLSARKRGPMSFHYVTGMGTDANGSQHWAREKGRAELELANLATGSDLRTYSYRTAYVRRTSEQAHVLDYIGEALLRPGKLVIPANELGNAMLEISARASELENGTLIDNADSIAYAEAHHVGQ